VSEAGEGLSRAAALRPSPGSSLRSKPPSPARGEGKDYHSRGAFFVRVRVMRHGRKQNLPNKREAERRKAHLGIRSALQASPPVFVGSRRAPSSFSLLLAEDG
jgi:hypothetical protein